MKVAITGSTGFVGSALVPYLEKNGIEVVRVVRASPFDSKSEYDSGNHVASP